MATSEDKASKEWVEASQKRLREHRARKALSRQESHALSLEALEQDDEYVSESQRKKAMRDNSLGGANCPLAAAAGGPSDDDLKAKVQQLELDNMRLQAKVSAFETHLIYIIKIVPSLLQWFVSLKEEQKEDMPPSITKIYQTGRGIVDNN